MQWAPMNPDPPVTRTSSSLMRQFYRPRPNELTRSGRDAPTTARLLLQVSRKLINPEAAQSRRVVPPRTCAINSIATDQDVVESTLRIRAVDSGSLDSAAVIQVVEMRRSEAQLRIRGDHARPYSHR